jgi:hypothetical protein
MLTAFNPPQASHAMTVTVVTCHPRPDSARRSVPRNRKSQPRRKARSGPMWPQTCVAEEMDEGVHYHV